MCVDLSAYFLPWLDLRSYSIIQSIKTCFVATLTRREPTISLSLLLAASGTSLPNCLVAMYVAKKGRGTTAVSTVFGSNIFDILIALALPWAIYSSIFGPITVFESLGFGTAYALTTIMIATFALLFQRRA